MAARDPRVLIAERLADLERHLDPAKPERGDTGIEILGYGEVSAVLGLVDVPDRVFKRMAGFRSRRDVQAYAGVVEQYISILRDLGVTVAATEIVPIEAAPRRHVAYVVQPRFDSARIGHVVLRSAGRESLELLLEGVFAAVHRVLAANGARRDGREIAVDAQLSNWYWPDLAVAPVLIDVSTPFLRKDGKLEVGLDVFLRAYPAPARWWLRRTHAVERYIADYFDFVSVVTDLIGNFRKEAAAERVAEAVAFANRWIAAQPDGAALGCLDEATVQAYYARDAATLETSLRIRRLARFITATMLRRRYDFILPGPIRR